MLVIKRSEYDNTILCEDIYDKVYLNKILALNYNVGTYLNETVINLFKNFDKLVLVSFSFPLTIGLMPYCTVLQGTSLDDLYHELSPYADDYIVIEQIDLRFHGKNSASINVIPLTCLPLAEHRSSVLSYVRKSTIDEILKELC